MHDGSDLSPSKVIPPVRQDTTEEVYYINFFHCHKTLAVGSNPHPKGGAINLLDLEWWVVVVAIESMLVGWFMHEAPIGGAP